MSVKIEILDYKKGEGGNLVDCSLATPENGWEVSPSNNQTAIFDNAGVPAGSTGLRFIGVTPPLVAGREYDAKLKITQYSGTGIVGLAANDVNGNTTGVGYNLRSNGTGTFTDTFTWAAGATGGLDIFCQPASSCTVSVELTDDTGIVWEKSIAGSLDVSDHSEFPLALTFQISDLKDITSTSGDFSKTFKIPATKNNNKILKQQFNPNIEYTGEPLSFGRKCRILINNFYSLEGFIKVNSIGGYGKSPSYYDCVFYGNNLSWAKDLDGKLMNETFSDGYGLWGADGNQLSYNKDAVVATWSQEHSESNSSPFVYPVVSYGDYNTDGIPYTVQLLDNHYGVYPTTSSATIGYQGFNNYGDAYGTPPPASDWRPALWVKTTLEAIFSKIGYSISSDFMNTDKFKKLVWLLPNFKYNNADDRYNEFGMEYKWVNQRTTTVGSGATAVTVDYAFGFTDSSLNENDYNFSNPSANNHYTGSSRDSLGFNTTTDTSPSGYNVDIVLDNNSRLSTTNNEITIGEFGYYNIRFPIMQVKVATLYHTGSQSESVEELDCCINIELKTAGQTTWNIIGQIESLGLEPLNSNQTHIVTNAVNSFTAYQETEGYTETRWLNKNDKIRFTKGIRLTQTSDPAQNFYVSVIWRAKAVSDLQISLDPTPVSWGQTYDLDKVINKNYKQLDFVKGVAHAFNLTLTTDEIAKIVYIEPFDDFYKTYEHAIDWTQKLDRSKEIKDTWIKKDLKRDVVFKYKSDSKDLKVQSRGERYFNKIHDESPFYETLSDSFEKGTSVFENPFFAGTYNAQDSDAGGSIFSRPAYSACLWETTVSAGSSRANTPKGFDFLPRLLSYRKYSPASTLDNRHQVNVQIWSGNAGFRHLVADSSASVTGFILSNKIPQATMINRHSNEMPVLSYGNAWIEHYDENGNYDPIVSGKGLFETYYKKMFEMVKNNPRIRTVYLNLKLSDITSLDFRKLVYIDGVYYRINKVIDYKPNKNTVTKVELICWKEFGTFAASAPPAGSSNTTNWGNGIYINTDDVEEFEAPHSGSA